MISVTRSENKFNFDTMKNYIETFEKELSAGGMFMNPCEHKWKKITESTKGKKPLLYESLENIKCDKKELFRDMF